MSFLLDNIGSKLYESNEVIYMHVFGWSMQNLDENLNIHPNVYIHFKALIPSKDIVATLQFHLLIMKKWGLLSTMPSKYFDIIS